VPLSRIRILIAEPKDFSPRAVSVLEQLGEVTLSECGREELRAAFREYDVVWFRLAHHVDETFFEQPVRLRVLATPVTGLDHIDLEACRRSGVRVVSLKGETEFLKSVRATAELTIALTLALLRRIPEASASVVAGQWNRDEFRGRELFGRTAGLVGVGRLGTLVAGYLRAFGMDVIGYDPRPDYPYEVARRVDRLDDLLSQSDIVSLHVGYDDVTRHLIGATELGKMKRGAVLVNTSRGGVVDEAALLAALDAGQIAGAALDVLDGEPYVRPDHPVILYAAKNPRLLVVPHIGGNTKESFRRTEVFLAGRVSQALLEHQ
jgi:D-3-phosphoglycerate dehydrogenase